MHYDHAHGSMGTALSVFTLIRRDHYLLSVLCKIVGIVAEYEIDRPSSDWAGADRRDGTFDPLPRATYRIILLNTTKTATLQAITTHTALHKF
jgi:hypothetical protein